MDRNVIILFALALSLGGALGLLLGRYGGRGAVSLGLGLVALAAVGVGGAAMVTDGWTATMMRAAFWLMLLPGLLGLVAGGFGGVRMRTQATSGPEGGE